MHGYKGDFGAGPTVSARLTPTRAPPGESTAYNCDASVPAGCGLAEPARGHDGAVTSVTSAEMPAHITAPMP
jgi:hypothetical protein